MHRVVFWKVGLEDLLRAGKRLECEPEPQEEGEEEVQGCEPAGAGAQAPGEGATRSRGLRGAGCGEPEFRAEAVLLRAPTCV